MCKIIEANLFLYCLTSCLFCVFWSCAKWQCQIISYLSLYCKIAIFVLLIVCKIKSRLSPNCHFYCPMHCLSFLCVVFCVVRSCVQLWKQITANCLFYRQVIHGKIYLFIISVTTGVPPGYQEKPSFPCEVLKRRIICVGILTILERKREFWRKDLRIWTIREIERNREIGLLICWDKLCSCMFGCFFNKQGG